MSRGALVVGNFLSGTRAHRHYCENFAERIATRGWHVVTTSRKPGRVGKLADMLRTTWATRREYQVAHVDVFSGPAFLWAEAVVLELRALRKPFVLTLRGGNLPNFAKQWPRRVRRLLGSAALVTSPSEFLREALSPYHRDIVVLPNGIDLARYPYVARGARRPELVWLRAFHAVYNPVLAVDVLARVVGRHPDARLLMVGPDRGDGSRDAVTARARDTGMSDRIEIVEGVPNAQVPAQLARGEIFLNTSDVDNTPITVLEAMACGLPVVSTTVGGIPHLVTHEQTALLVPPRDPSAMAAAVERILVDPALASRISTNAREAVNERDWAVVVERWDHLLGSLAHE